MKKNKKKFVLDVRRRTKMNLNKGLIDFGLCWQSSLKTQKSLTISGRFSHSAVINGHTMYIFGGRSSTSTTFNDLWCFNLSNRAWHRPSSHGSYPSPKACASMISYNKKLILFGGVRHGNEPFQLWKLFNEIHVYDIEEYRWHLVSCLENQPPEMAGHSASLNKNQMVVFGGYQKTGILDTNSNDLWCLDLNTFVWHKQETTSCKPSARYGQFQISLDDDHLLILGGCGGPNNVLSDAWLLRMTGEIWTWQLIPIRNKKFSANHMWCYPACKVGNKLVVLGPTSAHPQDFQMARQIQHCHNPNQGIPPPPINVEPARMNILDEANRRLHEERNRPSNRENINAGGSRAQNQNNDNNNNNESSSNSNDAASRLKRNLQQSSRNRGYDEHLLPKRFDDHFIHKNDRFDMAAFHVDINPNTSPDRERQQERLRRMQEKYYEMRRAFQQQKPEESPPKRVKKNSMGMFVCDISNVIASKEPFIEWMEYKNYGIIANAPEKIILSTLVAGEGELVMFGGLVRESLSNTDDVPVQVSNSVHFLTVPRGII